MRVVCRYSAIHCDHQLTFRRLILYYPVSALVTLFANILQNPQDARARSDLKLMSSVVSFLTMLERDVTESNGNVRRMLSVCAEFERIAKVVLDKAERDMRSGRGKRKANTVHTQKEQEKAMRDRGVAEVALAAGLDEGKTLEQMQVETQAAYRRPIQTPSLRASKVGSQAGSGAGASPASWGGSQPGGTGPEYRTPPQVTSGINGYQQQMQNNTGQWNVQHGPNFAIPNGTSPNLNTDFTNTNAQQSPPQPAPANFAQPQQGLTDGFDPKLSTGFSPPNGGLSDPLMAGDMGISFDTSPNMGMAGSFQQPFVPQDLWQMPMTLEWDWAEGLGLGSFTPGPLGNFDGGGGGGYTWNGGENGGGSQQ